jgi:hypothetical protein
MTELACLPRGLNYVTLERCRTRAVRRAERRGRILGGVFIAAYLACVAVGIYAAGVWGGAWQ